MFVLLERFLPTVSYTAETPERVVKLDGKPMPGDLPEKYDPSFQVHLNTYRPLWAIGGMKSLLAQKKKSNCSVKQMSFLRTLCRSLFPSRAEAYTILGLMWGDSRSYRHYLL